MKILMVFNNYEYRGGEEMYVSNLSRLLVSHGHRVIPYFKDSRDLKKPGSKIAAGLGLLWNPTVARELELLIRKHRPDVAHFHNIYPLISPTAYWVCRKNKVKIIQTIHNYKPMCPKNSLFRRGRICEQCVGKAVAYPAVINGCYHGSHMASLAYSLAFTVHRFLFKTFSMVDAFIFPSPFTKRYYEIHGYVPPGKAFIISNFVQPQRPFSPPTQAPYFLFAGRLSEEKGILPLIEAFARLPRYRLVVIGDGPLRRQAMDSSGASANIRFVSHLKNADVLRYIGGARAVIVPSLWYEVQPNIILEAIASGKPVIVPKNANFTSWLPSGCSLSYGKDGLKKAIVTAAKKTFNGQTIKNEYNTHYSPAVHYRRIITLYENITRP